MVTHLYLYGQYVGQHHAAESVAHGVVLTINGRSYEVAGVEKELDRRGDATAHVRKIFN